MFGLMVMALPALLGGEETTKMTAVKKVTANLYVEDVASCAKFWEKLGFTPDPLEFGTDAHYGLTADQFEQWLAEH